MMCRLKVSRHGSGLLQSRLLSRYSPGHTRKIARETGNSSEIRTACLSASVLERYRLGTLRPTLVSSGAGVGPMFDTVNRV